MLTGRFGPYVQLGEQEDGTKKKPKRASLFASQTPETVTLDEALQLLSLAACRRRRRRRARDRRVARPLRSVPEARRRRHAQPRRAEEQLLTVTLAEAEALFAQPKQRRGRQQKPPIAELGEHPDTGAPVRVLEGRYGPYVTDGTVNATVPAWHRSRRAHARRSGRAAARAGRDGADARRKKAAKKAAKKTDEEGREEDREEGGEEGDQEGREDRRRRPTPKAAAHDAGRPRKAAAVAPRLTAA